MPSNYKRLGDFIKEVNVRNTDLKINKLIGVSIEKKFISSVANIVGTDMSVYKVIKKNQLACKLMSVGRDEKLPVDLYLSDEPATISSAYYVFEPKSHEVLLPEYLKMWLFRTETDRYVGYISGGDVRGGISWDTFCDMPVIIPSIEKQKEIVREYKTIQNRIAINNKLISKLEEAAQAIYKQWFVDEIDLENLPEGWKIGTLSDIATIIMGQSPEGESYNVNGEGCPLINGPVEFGEYFTIKTKWTTEPKKYCKKGDLIFCVRGSTVGKNVIADDIYAIGRGVCAINAEYQLHLIQLIKTNLNEILKDVTGSTFPNIDRATLGNYPVLISTEGKLKDFEHKTKPIFEMIEIKANENQKLSELKDLLLAKMTRVESEKLIKI